MSIKTEILLKRKQAIEQSGLTKKDNENNNYIKSIEMLETFIIPKFKEMAENHPTVDRFWIVFRSNGSILDYFTTFNMNNTDSPYDFSVVKLALFKAEDYGIDAEYKKSTHGATILEFYLDLTN